LALHRFEILRSIYPATTVVNYQFRHSYFPYEIVSVLIFDSIQSG
jgi:hypothetical protein